MGSLKQWLQVLCDEEILAKVFKLCTEELNKISIKVSDFSVTQVLKQLATRHLWYYNQTPYDYNAKLCTIRPISYKSDIIAS